MQFYCCTLSLLVCLLACVVTSNILSRPIDNIDTEDNVDNEVSSVRNITDVGLLMRITTQGFQYAAQLGADILYQKLNEMSYIPTLFTQQNGVDITLSNLTIRDFSHPVGSAELIPGHGLRWILTINDTKVSGYWKYITHSWFTLQDEGNFLATLHETTLNITVEITRSSRGGLSMIVSDCQSIINFEMNLGSWLYNVVASLAKPFLDTTLQQQLCEVASGIIKEDAMTFFDSLPVNVTVHDNYVMDYSIVEPPIFTSDYMETYHKGEITWRGDTEKLPFSPKPIAPLMETDRMLYLQISDYLFNSYCYAAFSHKMLSFDITNNNLPGNILKTTCKKGKLCIGSLFPEIGHLFPNETVTISMVNQMSPNIAFDETIQVTFQGMLSFDIHLKNGNVVTVFMLEMDLMAHMNAIIRDSKIYSQIVKFNFTTIKHKGGIYDEHFNFNPLINLIVRRSIIPQINDQGKIGIPLVMMAGAEVQNTELKVGKHTLTVGSDFEFNFI